MLVLDHWNSPNLLGVSLALVPHQIKCSRVTSLLISLRWLPIKFRIKLKFLVLCAWRNIY